MKEEWLPSSPDLDVLDFCVWSVLEREACACAIPATSVKVLKKQLVKAWAEIDQKIFCATVDDFPCRLRAVIKSKGIFFIHYSPSYIVKNVQGVSKNFDI